MWMLFCLFYGWALFNWVQYNLIAQVCSGIYKITIKKPWLQTSTIKVMWQYIKACEKTINVCVLGPKCLISSTETVYHLLGFFFCFYAKLKLKQSFDSIWHYFLNEKNDIFCVTSSERSQLTSFSKKIKTWLSLLFSGLHKNATKNKIKRHVFFPDLPAQVFQHTLTRDTMDIMSACKTRLMGQKVPQQDIWQF